MANGLFQKLMSKFQKGPNSSGFRSAAMNGTDNVRLRIAQERSLDQETLSILARRGPRAVRLLVARHTSLRFDTARRLAGVDDQEFRDALEARFGELEIRVVATSGRATELVPGVNEDIPSAEVETVHEEAADLASVLLDALQAEELFGVTSDEGPHTADAQEPAVVVSPVDAPEPVTRDAFNGEPDASDHSQQLDESTAVAGLEAVDPVAPAPPDGTTRPDEQLTAALVADLAPDMDDRAPVADERVPEDAPSAPSVEPVLEFEEAPEGSTTSEAPDDLDLTELVELIAGAQGDLDDWDLDELDFDEYDPTGKDADAADILDAKIIQIFERIPDGPAGRALLERLSQKANGPTLRALVGLRNDGWDIDEISVVWWARYYWNESHEVDRFDYPLSYATVATLAKTFDGFPAEDELLLRLKLIEERWKSDAHRGGTPLNQYIRQKVSEYDIAWRKGGHLPLEWLFGGSS